MVTLGRRNADSFRRSKIVAYLKSVVEKIVGSGIKCTFVPVFDLGALPTFSSVVAGLPPFSKRCL